MENFADSKANYANFKRITLILLIFSAIFFSGCSAPPGGEVPVEPIIPEGSSTGLLSYFGSVTAGSEINDLVASYDGQEVLVAPPDNRVYLLQQQGRVLWEATLGGEAFRLAPSPVDPSFALATREGEVIFYDAEHQVMAERNLERKILDFSLAEDGSVAAALTLPPGEEAVGEGALLHLVDNRGFLLWEIPVYIDPKGPHDLHVSRQGEGVAFIGRHEEEPALMWHNLKGELLWEEVGLTRVAVSLTGDVVAAVKGPLLVVYDRNGNRKWAYDDNDVSLSDVLVSQNGQYVLAYSSYSTGQDNLFYFPARGDADPWKARVPAQSKISLSASGEDVVISSWKHYLEEFTLVSVYNAQGEETNSLQIAGRGRRVSLSPDGSTLVLSSDDGTIFFLDLKDEALMETRHPTSPPVYVPAVTGSDQEYVSLYFYDDNARVLIPVSRKVPSGEAGLKRVLAELIKGPRLGSGLSRTLPRDVEVSVEIMKNTAYIDLPAALVSVGGSAQAQGLVNSLLYSSSHFPEVNWVQFQVEGGEGDIQSSYYDFSRPIPVRRPGMSPGRQVLYTPVLSDNRYYLTVTEVSLQARDRQDLADSLLSKLLDDNRTFFSRDMYVKSVLINGEKAQVDFAADPDELQKLLRDPDRSELLLDAVTLTLAENFALNKVEVLINGFRSQSEQSFPQLMRTIERPIFINPE